MCSVGAKPCSDENDSGYLAVRIGHICRVRAAVWGLTPQGGICPSGLLYLLKPPFRCAGCGASPLVLLWSDVSLRVCWFRAPLGGASVQPLPLIDRGYLVRATERPEVSCGLCWILRQVVEPGCGPRLVATSTGPVAA